MGELQLDSATPADQAIPRLLDAYGGKLYGLGLRLCGNEQDAQDLVQETFTNAFRKWDQFEGRASAKTWLFSIATRACMRMHRPKSGQPEHIASLQDLVPSLDEGVPDPDVIGSSPFESYLKQEAREVLGRALAELHPDFRIPVILKDIMGLSLIEVGAILDVKPATIKTRLHRARLQLREVLLDEVPRRPSEMSQYSDRVCLDLLEIKLDAMDRGVSFPVPDIELAERCDALHQSLDMTQSVCRAIGDERLPDNVKTGLMRACLPEGEERAAALRDKTERRRLEG